MQKSVLPHILIDGRAQLTGELYLKCKPRPLVLSSRPVRRSVPHAFQFCPTNLILGSDQREWNRHADLIDILGATRLRLHIEKGEPLRIVCVGSHGSIWHRECANAGGELGKSAAECVRKEGYELEPESHVGGHLSAEAIQYLQEARHSREYINALYNALQRLGGLEFHWLAGIVDREARPRPPEEREAALYGPVAERARRLLAEDPALRRLGGAVPLIFTRSCSELEWRSFEPLPGASRINRNLLAQFGKSEFRRRMNECRCREMTRRQCECVFVKLLPTDAAKHNPCDNPMTGTNQLEVAKAFGISAVLLDRERGVIARDTDHAKSETLPVIGF